MKHLWVLCGLLSLLFSATPAFANPADFNRDGRVDFQDFLTFTREFGAIDPQPVPDGAYRVWRVVRDTTDLQIEGILSIRDNYVVFGLLIQGMRIATWGPAKITRRTLTIWENDHAMTLPITILSPREWVIISKGNDTLGMSDARLYLRAIQGGGRE